MANLSKPLNQGFAAPSIVANYGPYTSVSAAHAALADDGLNIIGMTVGIQPTGSDTITEYWYQGGTGENNLVEKGGGNKDKAYNPSDYSGMGKVYLKRNIGYIGHEFIGFTNPVDVNLSDTLDADNPFIFWDSTRGMFIASTSKTTGAVYYAKWTGDEQYKNLVVDSMFFTDNNGTIQWYTYTGTTLLAITRAVEANILTQSMMTATNTIYVIQDDFDLNGETITVPANCVLEFDGGSLSNGKIIGNSTVIKSTKNLIFKDVVISGTWNNDESYSEWFLFDGVDDSVNLQNLLNFKGVVYLENRIYIVNSILFKGADTNKNGFLTVYSNTTIIGNGATVKLADGVLTSDNANMFISEDDIDSLSVENVVFDGNSANNKFNFSSFAGARTAMFFRVGGGQNVKFDRCSFINCAGRNAITLSQQFNGSSGTSTLLNNAIVTNCLFKNGGAYISDGTLNTNQSDFTFLFSDYKDTLVDNCSFIEADLDTEDAINGVSYSTRYDYVMNASSVLRCGGVEIHNSNSTVRNSLFVGCRPAVFIAPSNGPLLENATVCSNSIQKCKDGIMFYHVRPSGATSGNSIKNAKIFDNTIDVNGICIGETANGSYLSPRENILISGNTIRVIDGGASTGSIDRFAIHFNNLKNCMVSNNSFTCSDCSFFSLAYYASSNDIIIKDNNVKIDSLSARYGIYIRYLGFLSTETLNRVHITNNSFIFIQANTNNICFMDFEVLNGVRNANTQDIVYSGNVYVGCKLFNSSVLTNTLESKYGISFYDNHVAKLSSFIGEERPTPSTKGEQYFDTSIGKNIYYLNKTALVSQYGAPWYYYYSTNPFVKSVEASFVQYSGGTWQKTLEFIDDLENPSHIITILDSSELNVKDFQAPSASEYPYMRYKANREDSNVGFRLYAYLDWCEGDGASAGVNRSGTFAQRPPSYEVYAGFRYFCTDKQTPEGQVDGIDIIYKGDDVWVDPLGRILVWKVAMSLSYMSPSGKFIAEAGQPYTTSLIASSGYTLPVSIIVEMGSTTLVNGTDYTYNQSTGEVVVLGSGGTGGVTDNLTIRAAAVVNS